MTTRGWIDPELGGEGLIDPEVNSTGLIDAELVSTALSFLGAVAHLPMRTARAVLPIACVASTLVGDFLPLASAMPLGAGCELPDDPRLGRRPLSFSAYPSVTRAESVEQFPLTPLAWLGSWPDTTRRAALHTAQPLAFTTDTALEQRAVPALSWRPQAPDTTRRSTLLAAHYVEPFTFALQGLTIATPALSWQPSYPDRTWRLALVAGQHPSTRTEALEQFSVPPMSWFGSAPSTTRRASLLGAHDVDPLTFALQALATVVPPLSWAGIYPDATRRPSLVTAQLPALFRGEALEQLAVPALAWWNQYPDRVWAVRLQAASMQAPTAYADKDLVVAAPALAWSPRYPDTTRRLSLHPSAIPALFKGEAIEQFAPRLLWSSVGPDRIWRLTLATAHHPALARTSLEAPPLSWQPSYPPTTRRVSLTTPQPPPFVHSEALAQFPPNLLWSARYPDTTRRARTLSDAVRATIGWSNWINPIPPPLLVRLIGPGFVATTLAHEDLQIARLDRIVASPYADAVQQAGAIAYYRLDEAGPTFRDAIAGVDGTTIGTGITPRRPGALADGDGAVGIVNVFPGPKSSIDAPINPAITPLTRFTQVVWLRAGVTPDPAATLSMYATALGDPIFDNGLDGIGLSWIPSYVSQSGIAFWDLFAEVYVENGLPGDTLVALHTVNDAGDAPLIDVPSLTWVNVAVTFDGTTVCLYVNGTLIRSVVHAGVLAVTNGRLRLGGTFVLTSANDWNGDLDEYAIYARALTASEVAAHYALRAAVPTVTVDTLTSTGFINESLL